MLIQVIFLLKSLVFKTVSVPPCALHPERRRQLPARGIIDELVVAAAVESNHRRQI